MAPKRKSTTIKASPKKAKAQQRQEEPLSVEKIKAIVKGIKEEAKYNDIVVLLDQYNKVKEVLVKEENEAIEASGRQLTMGLYQVFQYLFPKGLLKVHKKDDEKKVVLIKWLISKYDSFKTVIIEHVSQELSFKSSLQLDMLDVYVKLIKLESEYFRAKDELYFPYSTYKALVLAFVNSNVGTVLPDNKIDNFVFLEFQDKLNKYYDFQYYFFQSLHDIISQSAYTDAKSVFAIYYTAINESQSFQENIHSLKEEARTLTKNLPLTVYKASSLKRAFQDALFSVLTMKLSSNQYKSFLLIASKKVLPYLSQPSRLMDFLTDSYNTSDLIIQILSLNSLYELMKMYNLEYPDFYTKLYSLLTPNLLYNRYRSRFFRLTDLFLSSTHLSSQLVASFIKKLATLSIIGPAPAVVIIIPFIYNLLKRHPSCMVMIQNPDVSDDYVDPYDDKETDPLNTKAINSSLWELEALMNHYHPNISTLAKLFNEPFRKPHYNLEDFLDWSYKSLFDSETNKKYRSMAALEYEEWEHLFTPKNGESLSVYLNGWVL
jgi:U3 small nucleolar RNA-associated protein 19